MQRKGNGMSYDLVKRLRESRSVWENARGVPSDLEREAADRISALEAALVKADELAEAVGLQRSAQRNSVSPRTALTFTAYRQARDATR